MVTSTRAVDRGQRRALQALRLFADECHQQRLAAGLSQHDVAAAAGMSRSVYGRIERAVRRGLTIVEAARVGAVLGLDLSLRLFPAADPLRDAAQQRLLAGIRSALAEPAWLRTEVALPTGSGRLELRAWDAQIVGGGQTTRIEVEMRLYDAQAQERHIALKRRDDPGGGFLLVIADTRLNRRTLATHPELWPDLPRVKASQVLDSLAQGRHPPSGLVLLPREGAPARGRSRARRSRDGGAGRRTANRTRSPAVACPVRVMNSMPERNRQ